LSAPHATHRGVTRSAPGRTRMATLLAAAVLLAGALVALQAGSTTAAPSGGFADRIVLSETTTPAKALKEPTSIEFAANGAIFVAEKRGVVKSYRDLADKDPVEFAAFRGKVHNMWDRGLLGLALPPSFPDDPWVYVAYTHNAVVGGTAPRWFAEDGSAGGDDDDGDICPPNVRPDSGGCEVTGRVARLKAEPTKGADGKPDGRYKMTGAEHVLIDDFCQQWPSHSLGGLEFGADGALYVAGGDGASFQHVDKGQLENPCDDPPGEGGSLRSQDLRSSGDDTGLSGSILRIDPETGEGLPGNPLADSDDADARRIIATGLRNPHRIAVRPGTSEVWAGDVGWTTWEEINRVGDPGGRIEDFGWPCREGAAPQGGYADAPLCGQTPDGVPLQVTDPVFAYDHAQPVVNGDGCATGSSSITGVAFYEDGLYPDSYDGALFFADYARRCIWVLPAGADGNPDPNARAAFVPGAAGPVDLTIGPAGDLFYVDIWGSKIHRIQYTEGNRAPVAAVKAAPAAGKAPLAVRFNASTSADPDGDTDLHYTWDLDGDGAFDDGTDEPKVRFTYAEAGVHTAKVRVTDSLGAADDASVTVNANGGPPTAVIAAPTAATHWKAGDVVPFSGSATDAKGAALPASALTWKLVLHHCAANDTCHEHEVLERSGVASGELTAPDHEFPSYLELRLTAAGAGGLSHTASVRLDPATVKLSFATEPAGLELTVNGQTAATPFTREVIAGSGVSIAAAPSQTYEGGSATFAGWSDGGEASHDITAPATDVTLTARYAVQGAPPSSAPSTTTTTTTTTTLPPATSPATTTTKPEPEPEPGTTTGPEPTTTEPATSRPPVVTPTTSGDGALPFSGAGTALPLALGGLVLLLLGTAGVVLTRRRRG
jgi:glucose/arabinose dehydrogenase